MEVCGCSCVPRPHERSLGGRVCAYDAGVWAGGRLGEAARQPGGGGGCTAGEQGAADSQQFAQVGSRGGFSFGYRGFCCSKRAASH